MKDKRERFVALAEKRVPRAIRELRLIGNLFNTNNYSYSAEEGHKILTALEQELKLLKGRFSTANAKGQRTFKLQGD